VTAHPDPIRIVVADDQDVVRTAFGAILATQPDFRVVGLAADGQAAIQLTSQHDPDVIVMDVRMPVVDGIEATRRITKGSSSARPRILMLTTFDLDEHVYDALEAGASGFLLKDVTAEQLFDAVRVIAAGNALLSPTVTRRLIVEFARRRPRTSTADPSARLTPRELEVLKQLAEGRSNAEIASELCVSDETIKTHVSRLLAKLDLRDRTQAVVLAYETGIVSPRRLG
jgi:DNA-binding NarL/FixJ family response regulator